VCAVVEQLLADNPHSTLQILLEPTANPRSITPDLLANVRHACYRDRSYLDRFYAILPGPPRGAKRLVVLLPHAARHKLSRDWLDQFGPFAEIAWRGTAEFVTVELAEYEYLSA
jgi:hypothetical protein